VDFGAFRVRCAIPRGWRRRVRHARRVPICRRLGVGELTLELRLLLGVGAEVIARSGKLAAKLLDQDGRFVAFLLGDAGCEPLLVEQALLLLESRLALGEARLQLGRALALGSERDGGAPTALRLHLGNGLRFSWRASPGEALREHGLRPAG